MTQRLTTDDELIAWCANGAERVAGALTSGDPVLATETLERVLDSRAAMLGTYATWTSHTLGYLAQRLGAEDMASWMKPERDVVAAASNDLTSAKAERVGNVLEDPKRLVDEIVDHIRMGEVGEAWSCWEQFNDANLAAHQFRRDVLTGWWADIYRAWGAEGLRDLLEVIGSSPGWRSFLESSLEVPLVDQVRDFAFILTVGNYGSATLTEHADRFELRYNVCGSCGMQELAGRYEGPAAFARTSTEVPGFDSGDSATTVYRAHQAMLHSVAAIEAIGKPHPVINCDGPGGSQGCRFLFFKNETPSIYYDRVGRQGP